MDWGSIRDTGLNKGMSIKDKIKSAKTDGWLAEGLTDEEIKESIKSAKAETYRDMLNSLLNDTNPYGIDEYAYMCNQIKGIFTQIKLV